MTDKEWVEYCARMEYCGNAVVVKVNDAHPAGEWIVTHRGRSERAHSRYGAVREAMELTQGWGSTSWSINHHRLSLKG